MKIIANPRAGHGKGNKNIARLERLIRRRRLDLSLVLTRHPGHATEIARDLAERGAPRLAVMGGDGTVREVGEGLVGSDTELAIVSMGTGNDIARSLDLPLNDMNAGIDVAQHGVAVPMDVGRDGDRHFLSVLGIGFPVIVAQQANETTWLKGSSAFFVSVYRALYQMTSVPMMIDLGSERFERQCVAVMVQNTPFTGGGLQMAPDATLDDGLLDIVIVDDIGKFDLMLNFPKAYRGRHLEHPAFSLHRSPSVQVSSTVPMPKMFDGDVHGRMPADVTVVPRGLNVVVRPAGSSEV